MVAFKNMTSLNNRSIKYLLRVFKIESLKIIFEKSTYSYVIGNFFQGDKFLSKYSSGKFDELLFCDSYFGEHLLEPVTFYNAYH